MSLKITVHKGYTFHISLCYLENRKKMFGPQSSPLYELFNDNLKTASSKAPTFALPVRIVLQYMYMSCKTKLIVVTCVKFHCFTL